MSSSSTAATVGISWSKLPDGPLAEIANRMDTKFDVLRLRAVCKSWCFSLSAHSSDQSFYCPAGAFYSLHGQVQKKYRKHNYYINREVVNKGSRTILSPPGPCIRNCASDIDDVDFPLNRPIQVSPAVANSTSASFFPPFKFTLHRTTIYRLTPAWDDSANPWVIRVSESKPKTFSLIHPLTGKKIDPFPESDHLPRLINLLRFRIMRITHLYHVEMDAASFHVTDCIKKVALTKDFFENGDRVLLVLTFNGRLALWRFGDESWTWITTEGRGFNDIISDQGKFYATSDYQGGLVLIDSRLQPIQLVEDLIYGTGWITHLVECGSKLFLVDQIDQIDGETDFSLSLFKLDDKSRFWDYEVELEDERVIFLCSDGNFSISMMDYMGCSGNCIYFSNMYDEVLVFDLMKNKVAPSDIYVSLFLPPPSWFGMIPSSTSIGGSLSESFCDGFSDLLLPPL